LAMVFVCVIVCVLVFCLFNVIAKCFSRNLELHKF
jgi:hypothetical protein